MNASLRLEWINYGGGQSVLLVGCAQHHGAHPWCIWCTILTVELVNFIVIFIVIIVVNFVVIIIVIIIVNFIAAAVINTQLFALFCTIGNGPPVDVMRTPAACG
jgi:hypothetical protein